MIIGITGKKGHGKDTIAQIFQKHYNDTETFSFAGPLKEALSLIFGIKLKYFYDEKLKETFVWDCWTPRSLLQWFGTEVIRKQFDKETFIKSMKNRLMNSDKILKIVTDVRFDNEAELIHKMGGFIIKVDASERVPASQDTHDSEKGIDSMLVDFVLYNNGTKEQLKKEAIMVVNEIV